MSRQYQTKSGVYTEADLAVVVWMNPKTKTKQQSRALETMTSETSRYPMAFPLKSLTSNRSFKLAKLARTADEVYALIQASERTKPIIVPLTLAKSVLGWEEFYVPTEYTDA